MNSNRANEEEKEQQPLCLCTALKFTCQPHYQQQQHNTKLSTSETAKWKREEKNIENH